MAGTAFAQSHEKPTADEYFEKANYVQAIDEYFKLEKKDPNDIEIKHHIGTCCLKIHDYKSKALNYLKFCYDKGSYKNELLLEMAQAYHYLNDFNNAIIFYNKFHEKAPAKNYLLIDHYIETCENAKELIKKRVNVTFENLGKEINTKYPDYFPFVTKDHGTLFFTSRRDANTGSLRGFNGYFTSDVYTSKVTTGQWTKAKNMGAPLNSAEDEECVGISPDGKSMIIYVENPDFLSDLFHTEISKTKLFARPVPFNEPVNTEQLEYEGCYAQDANTLYFTSNRKGGLGETDIYSTHRLPTGEWGVPQNLGAEINSPFKDAFPIVSDDGQTLYFSSQGHTSMGGFDIFKSKWNASSQKWGAPVNIGYPVNTSDDDMMFSLAGNGRDGYISACRKEGLGDLDIYKIIFNDVEQQLTALVGTVKAADTTLKIINADISITDLKTNDELDVKEINKKNGKYIFIVEPGKYRINVSSKGYADFKEDITVFDKSDFVPELTKHFLLQTSANPKQ